MSILGSLTGALTSGLDLFVGGQLEKAYLEVDKEDDRATSKGEKLTFQFNPETIKVNRVQARTSAPVLASQISRSLQYRLAVCGRSSLTHVPFSPCCEKEN